MIIALLPSVILANPRANGTTKITVESVNGGGGSSANGALCHIGNFGGPVGISAGTFTTVKQGFIAQLTEVKNLQLSASPTSVPENGNRQISGTFIMDDDSRLAAESTEFDWSIQSGPASINSTGSVTGLAVYEDTPAVIEAAQNTHTTTMTLTVLNALQDNFGTYAGDGIDDDWQVLHFGLNTPLAAPTANPDSDSANNLMEFLTGYDPTDGSKFFSFAVTASNDTSTTLQLSKVISGTRYLIERSETLAGWSLVTTVTALSEVTQHTLTIPSNAGDQDFYRIGIKAE